MTICIDYLRLTERKGAKLNEAERFLTFIFFDQYPDLRQFVGKSSVCIIVSLQLIFIHLLCNRWRREEVLLRDDLLVEREKKEMSYWLALLLAKRTIVNASMLMFVVRYGRRWHGGKRLFNLFGQGMKFWCRSNNQRMKRTNRQDQPWNFGRR